VAASAAAGRLPLRFARTIARGAHTLRPSVLLLALAGFAIVAGAANAQMIPKQKGATRVMGLFDFLCLKQLPDLNGIERAAGFGEYDQLTGGDLAPYAPATPSEKLFGWRYHDHGEEFVLIARRARPDADFAKREPAFAAAMETSCTLHVLAAKHDTLLGELTRVMGRKPDQTLQEGSMHVYAWTHRRADALSYVRYYMPENAGAKAMLNASVFVKK